MRLAAVLLCLFIAEPLWAIVYKGTLGYRLGLASSQSKEYTPGVGYQVGLRYVKLLQPNLVLKTGAFYSQVYFSWEVDERPVTGGLNYLDVPLFLAYWTGPRTNFYIGPQIGSFLTKSCPQEQINCDLSGAKPIRMSVAIGGEHRINKNLTFEIYVEHNIGRLTNEVSSLISLGGNLILEL